MNNYLKVKTENGVSTSIEFDPEAFRTQWDLLALQARNNSAKHGFIYPQDIPTFAMARSISLMHSELSEALEAIRLGNPDSKKIPGNSQLAEELADVVLRIMDFDANYGYTVSRAIVEKMDYNRTRPYKHGGKLF